MLTLCLAFAMQTAEPATDAAPDFTWLTGHWVRRDDFRYVEEIWTEADGGLMTGMNRSVLLGDRTSFEFMRIEFTDRPVYIAQPSGGEPVRFELVDHGDQYAYFANPDHDFPTDIVYAREGDTLTARISGPPYGPDNAVSWLWTLRTD